MKKTVVLIILDGWGIGAKNDSNAIYRAKTPTLDYFQKFYPAAALQSAGIAVGLPWSEPGNSEVGHLTLGAGRVLYQHLPRITLSIKGGGFFKNPALLGAFNHAQRNQSKVHIIGLLSDGNVHSSYDHLRALIKMAKENGPENTFFHLFTDGKDSPPQSAKGFLENFLAEIKYYQAGKLASLCGRYYAMDRRKNWKLTEQTYNLLTLGQGRFAEDPLSLFDDYYQREIADPYILPTMIADKDKPEKWPLIENNDALIFFNFREDSVRQIASSFALSGFDSFEREKKLDNIYSATMTEYDEKLSAQVAFPPETIINGLSETLSKLNKKQLKIAETEKFFHLTYFFNGITDKVFENEFRVLIPSKEIPHPDKAPEMRAAEITDRLALAIADGAYDFIVVNYANVDAIAHTGNFDATVSAAEFVDSQLKRVFETSEKTNASILITSDHGNAEQVYNSETGEKETEHNANPVPFYLIDSQFKRKKEKTEKELIMDFSQTKGIIGDVAPTILQLLDLEIPKEMKGKSLLDYIV